MKTGMAFAFGIILTTGMIAFELPAHDYQYQKQIDSLRAENACLNSQIDTLVAAENKRLKRLKIVRK